jgi:hypothetical protein
VEFKQTVLVNLSRELGEERAAHAVTMAERDRLRLMTEDKLAPNTLEWRRLVDELRQQVAEAEHQTREHAKALVTRQLAHEQQVTALRKADLAWVTAFGNQGNALEAERAAHAETRKALDSLARVVGQALIVPTLEPGESLSEPLDHALIAIVLGQHAALESTRAELAKSKARVKELETENERALRLCESMQGSSFRG